jgi:endonuclease G
MKNVFLFVLPVIISLGLTAQDFNYLPEKVGSNQTIEYTQFTLSYNNTHKQADWVAYELTAEEVAKKQDRCNCFSPDKRVVSGSATKQDYTSTGFDRGHLCPAADNNMSEKANKESFLMSNMSPQLPQFNRKIWAYLEDWVRKKATAYNKIYVVTGPVFVNNLGTISTKKITIPGYYYKVLLRFEGTKVRAIAFLVPHVGADTDIKKYAVPINTIETITGLDFFPELDDKVENKVESQLSLKKWGL